MSETNGQVRIKVTGYGLADKADMVFVEGPIVVERDSGKYPIGRIRVDLNRLKARIGYFKDLGPDQLEMHKIYSTTSDKARVIAERYVDHLAAHHPNYLAHINLNKPAGESSPDDSDKK